MLIAPNPTSEIGAPFTRSRRAQPVASLRGGRVDARASTSTVRSSVVSAPGYGNPCLMAIVSPSSGRASELVPISTLSGSGGSLAS